MKSRFSRLALGKHGKAVSLVLMYALLLVFGWASGIERLRSRNLEMRQDLLRQVTRIASYIDPALARGLGFTPADAGTWAFGELCSRLRFLSRSIPGSGVYTLARRGDRYYFGPESYEAGHPLASPSGTGYLEVPAAARSGFEEGRSFTLGPYDDGYGSFVSAYAPVHDPQDNSVIMFLGVDIPAGLWKARVASAMRDSLLLTFGLIAFITLAAVMISWRNKRYGMETLKFRAWVVVPTIAALVTGLALLGGRGFLAKTGCRQARYGSLHGEGAPDLG